MTAPERDEEFEAYLQRRSSLHSELREHETFEPPEELDRIVLSRARQAISAQPELPVFKPARWAFPLALAATIVLSFTIVLSVNDMKPELAASAPTVAQQADADNGSGTRVAEVAPTSQLEQRQDAAAPVRERMEYAPAPPTSAAEKFDDSPRRSSIARGLAKVQTPATDAVVSEPPEVEQAPTEEVAVAANRVTESDTYAAVAAVTTAPAPAREPSPSGIEEVQISDLESVAVTGTRRAAPSRSQRQADPDLWMTYIEQLKADGKRTQAARELRALRKKFPEYAVPEDAQRAN